MAIGALGPRLTVGIASASGLDGTNPDGVSVLTAAFIAGLALLAYVRFGNRRVLLVVLGFALMSAAGCIYDQQSNSKTDVAIGWGLNLATQASIALAISAGIMLIRRGRSLVEPGFGVEPGSAAPDLVERSERLPEPTPAGVTSSGTNRLLSTALDSTAVREKTCPQCAEVLRAAAQVCPCCGFRFPLAQPMLSDAHENETSARATVTPI